MDTKTMKILFFWYHQASSQWGARNQVTWSEASWVDVVNGLGKKWQHFRGTCHSIKHERHENEKSADQGVINVSVAVDKHISGGTWRDLASRHSNFNAILFKSRESLAKEYLYSIELVLRHLSIEVNITQVQHAHGAPGWFKDNAYY